MSLDNAPIRPDHRCNVESSTLRPSGLSWPGTPTEFNELVQSGVDAARAASSYKNKPLSLEAVRSRARKISSAGESFVTRRRGKVLERGSPCVSRGNLIKRLPERFREDDAASQLASGPAPTRGRDAFFLRVCSRSSRRARRETEFSHSLYRLYTGTADRSLCSLRGNRPINQRTIVSLHGPSRPRWNTRPSVRPSVRPSN